MIKEHFDKIVITQDGRLIGDKDGQCCGEIVFASDSEDDSYLTVDDLSVMSDRELPKCIKEIYETVRCYCYCPTVLKNIGGICHDVHLFIQSAIVNPVAYKIEQVQEMLDLTVNSYGIERISHLHLSLKRTTDGELYFNTDADVDLPFDCGEICLTGKTGILNLEYGNQDNCKVTLHPDFKCKEFEVRLEPTDMGDYINYELLPDLDESLEDGDFEFKDLARRIPPRIRNGKLNGTLKSVRWTTTTNLDDIWDKIPDQYKKIICRTMSRYIGSALKQIADDDGWEFTQKNGFGIHTCWGEDELKKLGIKKYNIDYRGGSCIHVRYEFHIEKFGGLPDLDESADIKINKRLKHKISTKIQKGEKSGDINSIHWTLTTSADEFWDKIPDDLKSEILERVCWVFVDRGGEEDEMSAEYEGIVGVQYSIWTDYSTDDILGMGFTAHDIVIREDNESSVLLSFKISLDKLGNLPDLDESLLERLHRLVG